MRHVLLCAAGIVIAGVAFAQSPAPSTSASILDLIAEESTVAYRIDADTDVYQLMLISDALAKASRDYYGNRSTNLSEYQALDRERKALVERNLRQIAHTGAADPAETAAIKELETRMKKVERPTGYYRVGEITRRGRDFIGVQELGSETEFLVPLDRILHVAVP